MKFKAVFLAIAVACSSFAQNVKTAQEILASYPSGADIKVIEEWKNSLKVDELRAIADYALDVAKTNLVAGNSIAVLILEPIFGWWHDLDGTELAPEYDAKFAEAGFLFNHFWVKRAPKSVEKWLVTARGGSIPRDYPAFSQYVRRGIENKSLYTDCCATLNFIAEAGTKGCCYYHDLDEDCKRVFENMPKIIRRRLRALGRPIVVKEGVNPVQGAIDELSSSLNAPRFSGLKEWIAKWFPDYMWIDVKWMSDEELSKFKDGIYYGEIDFNINNRTILKAHLGIEAYNEFVKKYNN